MLKDRDIINLPVYTESQQHVGRIRSFVLDPTAHLVKYYIVRTGGLLRGLLRLESINIDSQQVVELSKEKMVVKDLVIKEESAEEIKKREVAQNPIASISKKLEPSSPLKQTKS